MDRASIAGDVIKIGKTAELEALDPPGPHYDPCLLLRMRPSGAVLRRHPLQRRRRTATIAGHPNELTQPSRPQLAKLP